MPLVLFAKTLIDGTGREPLHNAAVFIEAGRIRQVGHKDSIPLYYPNTEIIDAGSGVLLPGLIDAHCHIFGMKKDHAKPAQLETVVEIVARGISSAKEWLEQGVTTIRDLGTTRNLDLQLRDMIQGGTLCGPRIFGSGRPIVMTGGLRTETAEKGIEVNSPDDARRAARDQLRAGVDQLKLFGSAGIGGGEGALIGDSGWEQLTVEELDAAITEAHKAGRRAAVHAIGNQSIKNAIRARADSIEHGTYMDEESASLMKAQGTFLIPTLAVTHTLATHGLAMGYQPNIPKRARLAIEHGRETVKMCHQKGVRIAVGTDPVVCDRMVDECSHLLECGLSPMEVLIAATRTAAEVIGFEREVGTIEVGKLADLVVLEHNPLDDIRALSQVLWVIQGGNVVYSAAGTDKQ